MFDPNPVLNNAEGKPAIIAATFCEVRSVATRKVVKFIFEVPAELANAHLQTLGGLPDPANPPWCAIALMDVKAVEVLTEKSAPNASHNS